MEEKHECKICWKRFVNGRTLGGHMSSHMLNHPLPSQPETASSSMVDLVQDRESETETYKKPTRKRSRLNRRSVHVVSSKSEIRPKASQEVSDQEPVSSVSDGATADEDVAFSLMMLSRDKWEKENEEEESDDDERWEKMKKKWFECETCEKVFKSYQALGGHRASHKKKRALEGSSSSSSSFSVIVVSEETTKKKKKINGDGHECPICLKVFSSGQALGGHKRSHATTATRAVDSCSPRKSGIISLIDLNLPAPPEEEDLVSCVF